MPASPQSAQLGLADRSEVGHGASFHPRQPGRVGGYVLGQQSSLNATNWVVKQAHHESDRRGRSPTSTATRRSRPAGRTAPGSRPTPPGDGPNSSRNSSRHDGYSRVSPSSDLALALRGAGCRSTRRAPICSSTSSSERAAAEGRPGAVRPGVRQPLSLGAGSSPHDVVDAGASPVDRVHGGRHASRTWTNGYRPAPSPTIGTSPDLTHVAHSPPGPIVVPSP